MHLIRAPAQGDKKMKLYSKARCLTITALVATALGGGMAEAVAEEVYQNSNVSVGYTNHARFDPVNGTGTADKKMTNFRLEHFGVNGYGDNYFMMENFHGKQIGNIPAFSAGGINSGSFGVDTTDHYLGVWVPRLSLSRVSGGQPSSGVVKDWYLAGRVEKSDYANFRSFNLGVSVDLNLPGFAFFETDLYVRDAKFTGMTSDKNSLFSRTYFVYPFNIGPIQLKLTPLLLVNWRKDERNTELYIQPDLWIVLNKSFEIGYRHEYHRYDDGARAKYNRVTPTVLAKWNF
jgi:nucleoside-specific outer membrane channel protein Tsx